MTAVTIDEAWPGFGDSFTVADLDRMPSDGHRYELMDGALVVSPRPTTVHQAVAGRLYGVLSAGARTSTSSCPSRPSSSTG